MTTAARRSRVRFIRFRAHEDELIERIANTCRVAPVDLLRGYILAGLRGELPCEGVLPVAIAATDTPAAERGVV
jgi:hypothetical protein